MKNIPLKYKVVAALVLVLAPVMLLFSWFSSRAVSQMEAQLAAANQNALQVYHRLLRDEIDRAEQFLTGLVWNNEDFTSLASQAGPGALRAVEGQFEDIIAANHDITALLLYSPATGARTWVQNPTVGYGEDAGAIYGGLRGLLEAGSLPVGWFVLELADYTLWLRVMERDGVYAVCLLDLDQLVRNTSVFYDVQSNVVFLKNNQALTQVEWIAENGILLDAANTGYYFSDPGRRYMVVQSPLVGLTLAMVTPYRDGADSISWLTSVSVVFFVVALASALVVLWYLRRYLLRPVEDLVDTMRRVRGGDLSARPADFGTPEFEQMHDTFNDMMEEITTLRIDRYERQLAAERAEMQALRLQIRPHFFLNCLKSIFGLAEGGRMQDIQNVILHLSPHLRYVFDLDTDVIPLEKELQMCENYISLQVHTQAGRPALCLSVDAPLLQTPVPPVGILTLLENCVKHGMAHDGSLEIWIVARMLEMDGERLAHITVRDSGNGFALPALEALNAGQQQSGHVGLSNVRARFELLYGAGFAMVFSNANGRGAQVELMFPVKEDDTLCDC